MAMILGALGYDHFRGNGGQNICINVTAPVVIMIIWICKTSFSDIIKKKTYLVCLSIFETFFFNFMLN